MKVNNLEAAQKLFHEGVKLLQDESYSSAEKFFLNSLDFAPGRLSTIHNLISIYIKTSEKKKLSDLLIKHQNLSNEKELLYGKAFDYYFKEDFLNSINLCNKIIKFEEYKFSVQDLLASNYKKQKKFLDALKIYRAQLKQKRNYLIFYNIGCLFLDLGRTKIAQYYFEKCKSLNNKYYTNLNNLSLCKLKLKEFKEGFLLFENRWNINENRLVKKFTNIKTPGSLSEIKNKKLLIWDEQGLGDTIQFSRFVIDLSKYTEHITFVVNPKLSEILKHLHKNVFVTSDEKLDKGKFDYQIPVCSLPKLLNISDQRKINYYKLELLDTKQVIRLDNNKINIGLAWSGNKNYFLDQYRSIPFQYFKKILELKNINYFKLSKDKRSDEEVVYKSYSNLFDMGENTFYEISNLIKELDLVISSDTSIIHLAGILNKKSILLLNYNSDWRWFNDINKTFWYPSIKIIKQENFDDWSKVFSNLFKEIKKLDLEKNFKPI